MASIIWHDGNWQDGSAPFFSPMSQGVWLSSMVFDGARYFEGVSPDLDMHCERIVRSAEGIGLRATKTPREIYDLAWEGISRFPADAELYIRPMFWAESGFVAPDPDTTRFALVIHDSPMPDVKGFSACIVNRRRPSPEVAPTVAKASCLYPNGGLAMIEARERGFDNAVMLDPVGNVAELATSNIWYVKEGVAYTPIPNGCFLNGVTRQRVVKLLREAGVEVVEKTVQPAELLEADEIFNTGNYGKVMPITRFEDRELQPGPVFKKARELYWKYAREKGGRA